MAGRPGLVKPEPTQWALPFACALLLAAKFWLIPRININWDEFYFLSNIHAATRGELTQGLQTAYTHLFAWLPGVVAGDEVTEIRLARMLMVALLGLSALLVQRLALRWFPPVAAWTAALAFLAMWPTLKHGGSFRADSLLLPLQLAALVVLTQPKLGDRSRGLIAGALLGVATVVSIKAVLLAPVVAVLGIGELRDWRRGMHRLAWLAAAALVTAALLLGAHLLSMSGLPSGTTGAAVQGVWQKTIGDTPWVPQYWTFRAMVQKDLAFWLVAAGGLGWALWRGMWAVAATALALLPILFYRNSFAYYYVVMWGPACLTIAAATAGVQQLSSRVARPTIALTATFSLAALLGANGLRQLPLLSTPRQHEQRELVAAVHSIFPEPVAYIDHSGMIASFRKVNFFMSTWTMERYLARDQPFMPSLLMNHQPPLLIENRGELVPGTRVFRRLLEQDRKIIENQYQPYWGPIRIAGAAANIEGTEQVVVLRLPFAGRYRLESTQPVRIDGQVLVPGAVIVVGEQRLALDVAMTASARSGAPLAIRLLWADARPPPASPPMSRNYYDGL